MEALGFIILSLSTWRISNLLVNEDGPWDILIRFRGIIGVHYVLSVRAGKNVVARAFLCIWCLSVWVGLFATLAFLVTPNITIIALTPFALSAVAIIIGEIVDGNLEP